MNFDRLPLNSSRPQRTLARTCTTDGHGYWSGDPIKVEFRPASENSGIVFVRSDLGMDARVPATIANRVESARRTTLECKGVRVDMVEHLLAALSGQQIDNCEIWVNAPEMPASDGSCRCATLALRHAGVIEQSANRRQIVVRHVCRVGTDAAWIEARPPCDATMHIDYQLDYGAESPIQRQSFNFALSTDAFAEEVASARTFVLEQEAIHFKSLGYGRNLSFEDLLVFGQMGPIQNELRFHNECARHKVLDLVGDVSLIGCDILANITAYRSGHQLNAELVTCLLREFSGKHERVAA